MSRLWMIAYDISEDRIRNRVRNILKNYGVRVQYSVFECELDGREKHALQKRLSGMLGRDDSLRWYPLCAWCRDKTILQGQGLHAEFPEFHLL
jgi:CRISPR-associated protein Cas2